MPLLGLLLCVRYINTRYPSLENPQGGSPILSWRLLLEDFSQANFLAEGGSVHKGVLSDGRTVLVKQHKLASSHGDQEFCSGVELLSCAHHQNVVMLIGFCNEDRRRSSPRSIRMVWTPKDSCGNCLGAAVSSRRMQWGLHCPPRHEA